MSPDERKLGGSMKTIEEEISGEFDKIRSPGQGSNKPRNSDSLMP